MSIPISGSGFLSIGTNKAYAMGTAYAQDYDIFGTNGAVFSADMVNGILSFNSGQKRLITGFVDSQHLTTNISSTVASTRFTVYYGGMTAAGGLMNAQDSQVLGSQNQLTLGLCNLNMVAANDTTIDLPVDQSRTLVGSNNAQSLIGKTLLSGSVRASQLGDVVLGGSVPTEGQVLTASSASAAGWQNPAGGSGLLSTQYDQVNDTASSTVNIADGNDNSQFYKQGFVSGPYYYILSGSNEIGSYASDLLIYDITNAPVLVSRTRAFTPQNGEFACTLWVRVAGDIAVVYGKISNGSPFVSRVQIWDIKDRTNPQLLKSMDQTVSGSGSYMVDMALQNGYLYGMMTDQNSNYHLMIWDLKEFNLLGHLVQNVTRDPARMLVHNQVVYFLHDTAISIYDVADPRSPSVLNSRFDLEASMYWDVAIQDRYMFVCGGAGFTVYSIDNPQSPQLVHDHALNNVYFSRMLVREDMLYLADDSWGPSSIQIWNVKNPAAPTLYHKINWPVNNIGLQDIQLIGSRVLVLTYTSINEPTADLVEFDIGGLYYQTFRAGAFDAAAVKISQDLEAKCLGLSDAWVSQEAKFGDLDAKSVDALDFPGFPVIKKFTISSGDLLTLQSNPKELLPALGGKRYQILAVSARYTPGSVAFAGGSSTFRIITGPFKAIEFDLDLSTLGAKFTTQSVASFSNDFSAVYEQAIALHLYSLSGDFTQGDGSVDIYLTLQIL